MTSTVKALDLLSHFSTQRPEIGLSQMCRIAKRDKATTYRHLQSLEATGFIEQNPRTKHYRLGPALLHLAQVREATVPREAAARPALHRLATETGETAHVTVLSGSTIYGLACFESPQHGIRAIIDITTFPLHATASGLSALAFGPEQLFDLAITQMDSYTDQTPTTEGQLNDLVRTIRETGFGRAERTYEPEIQGLSAPIFDHSGHYAGAVAVACVASRFTPALEASIRAELSTASRTITRNWGGTIPTHIENAWAVTLAHPNTLEQAS